MTTRLNAAAHPVAAKTTPRRFIAVVIGVGEHMLRIYRNRREARKLLEFDDRLLADIGIDRSTVQAALLDSLISDPSDRLNAERKGRAARYYRRASR